MRRPAKPLPIARRAVARVASEPDARQDHADPPEHVVRVGTPAVSIRRVHAEPAIERDAYRAASEIPWLALWPDRSIGYFMNADALVREVRRRDQRDAARADRSGRAALLITVITWNDIPPGFVPPKEGTSWKHR